MSSVTSGLHFTPVLTSGISYPGEDTWHRHRGPGQALTHLPRALPVLGRREEMQRPCSRIA